MDDSTGDGGRRGGERRYQRRHPGLKLLLLLFASIFLNVFFFCYLFLAFHQPPPGWARRAVAEAEAAAAASACSGHGRAFLLQDQTPVCDCNACYSGNDCSRPQPDCAADAGSDDPLFLEAYWKRHAEDSSLVVPGWQSMRRGGGFSGELERYVRLLHRSAGNAISDGKFVVFGPELRELMAALVHAVGSGKNASECVVAAPPHNPLYKKPTNSFDIGEKDCNGMRSSWAKGSVSSAASVIEYVSSPNDPDGLLKQSVLCGSSVISNRAYYWPHYSSIPSPADEDMMLFTITEVSGHAGIGFGWAIIKDKNIYEKALEYMSLNTRGVSLDIQLRVLKLVKVMISKKDGDIFEFGYKALNARWSKLHKLVSSSKRFSLQPLVPHYCNYFKRIRDPAPAYAWLKCEEEEDKDCHAILRRSGIVSRSGTLFEEDSRYARLSLTMTQDDFDMLMMRMEALVSKEWIASS